MATPFAPPDQSDDYFDIAETFFDPITGQDQGFPARNVPGMLGTRQTLTPNNRPAVSTRQLIRWLIPQGPIVEMYLNPQNISTNYKKNNASQRTMGGFITQYWGPELTVLNINGTTGTSGIEGINVLQDVYNSEQKAFDPYALFLAAKLAQDQQNAGLLDPNSALGQTGDFIGNLFGASTSALPGGIEEAPSLAALAYSIEMYWSGKVYRGYFNDFSIKESVDSLGLFTYDLSFTVTQERGLRLNFQPWHRDPLSGPSNSNPITGTPYSYGPLVGSR